MRLTLITSVLLFAIHGTGKAQFIEVADQRSSDTFYGTIIPVGSNYAIAARGNSAWNEYGPGHFVAALDTAGTEQWHLSTLFSTTSSWNDGVNGEMIASPNGGLYLLGPHDLCDTFGDLHLLEVDTNGNILFQQVIEVSEVDSPDRMATYPATHMALLGWTTASITDQLGNVMDTWTYPFFSNWSNRATGIWAADSTLLLATGDRLFLTDMNGIALDSLLIDEAVLDMTKYGEDILLLTSTHLYRLNNDLLIISTADYSASLGLRAFVDGDEQGYFRTQETLFLWDEAGTIEVVFVPELLSGQEITGMLVRDGLLVTSSTLTEHGMRTGLFRTYSLAGMTTSYDLDIALVNVVIDSNWFVVLPQNPSISSLYADLRVTLRNMGTEPIGSVVLSHRTGIPVELCGLPSTRIALEDLALMPGESREVSIDDLLLDMRYYSSSSPDIDIDVCLIPQSPNSLVDRSPTNNIACAALFVPVGLNDRVTDGQFAIYPNAFTDRITIQSPSKSPLTIRLYDGLGRVVYSERMRGSGTMALPALANGSYVIEATDGVRQWRQTLMRVDQ
ncbi:MAG: T9SS type A sorting domain-containing protein [Flavobacteriales bacterium]|nr:T9SS type A sorting domain-containing protein [Flavobacteriales bacterium]